MIFHSIIPYEVVFQNTSNEDNNITRTIMYNGRQVEISSLPGGQAQINRVISTSPKDFLDPKIQPGTIIELSK